MPSREEILKESRREVSESFPKILVNLAIAVLIWLFAVLVFLPLADTLGDPFIFGLMGMKAIISAIVIIALVIVFLRILKEVSDLIGGLAGLTALQFARGETSDAKLERYRTGFRGIGFIILAVIAYLFFLPMVAGLHPSLAGIILILLLLWAIITLFRVGGTFSEDIERKATEFSQKVEELKEPKEGSKG